LEINKAPAAKWAKVHICGRRPAVLEAAAETIAKCGSLPASHQVCDIRDGDQVEAMMDAIWREGPLTGLVNDAAANFISPTKDLSSRGHRDINRDGRQFLRDARRWKALDRRRTEARRRQQSRRLGVDRLGLCRSLRNGQDGVARHDLVARRQVGSLRRPSQRHRAGTVSNRTRPGESEPAA